MAHVGEVMFMGLGQHAVLLPLLPSPLFQLVKLNFFFLLLWKWFVVQNKLVEQREEETSRFKLDPPVGSLSDV